MFRGRKMVDFLTHKDSGIPGTNGWVVSAARLREDLYHLVTILDTDRYYWHFDLGIGELQKEFEQGELDHALITIAIRARMLSDHKSPRPKSASKPCGSLFIIDTRKDNDGRPLTLRDGCNKIIHAETREFQEREDGQYLTGSVLLKGTQLGKKWRAELNTFKFVKLILALGRELES
ncbi:MAG: hypothetical protein WEB50_03905 [Vicinamibacterales bacterium]